MAQPHSFRTSEFVLSAGAALFGVGLAVFGALHGRDLLTIAGTALAGLTSIGYSHSRGTAKGRGFRPPPSSIVILLALLPALGLAQVPTFQRVRLCDATSNSAANCAKVDASGNVSITGSISAGGGVVDTNNSSTATLGAGGVFTGTSTDVTNYPSLVLYVYSDVNSATGGVSVQFSSDGTHWDETASTTFTTGGTAFTDPLAVRGHYYRIVYTNGGSIQGVFRLQTVLKSASSTGDVLELSDTPVTTSHGQLTQSVPMAKNAATSVFVRAEAAGSADAVANPTNVVESGALLFGYNGATWDRLRSSTANGVQVDVTRLASGTTASAIDTGTCTNTNAVTSVTVLASNSSRTAATVLNAGTANVYVKLGSTATSSNPPLAPGQSLTIDGTKVYTGTIDALSSSGTQAVCTYSW